MFSKATLFAASLSAGAQAMPFSENVTLIPRAPQNIPSLNTGDLTSTELLQVQDAINDAFELASYVRTSPAEIVDPIFAKYFNEADRDTVNAVFDVILGGDPADPPGNPILTYITITPDFADANGQMTCTKPNIQGATLNGLTATCIVVICDLPGFGHGGIGKSYDNGNIPAIECSELDDRVSWKMTTLGAILLHEYTHFARLMTSNNPGPLSTRTDDLAYGVFDTRRLDKSQALDNADSYTWFATEVLWTVLCGKTYGDPVIEDDDDPLCDDSACEDNDELMDSDDSSASG